MLSKYTTRKEKNNKRINIKKEKCGKDQIHYIHNKTPNYEGSNTPNRIGDIQYSHPKSKIQST